MRRALLAVFALLVFTTIALAQNPRVFITDSQSWEMRGGAGGADGTFGGGASGGARPQTGEIIKTFGERCPNVTVNNKKEKADYVVLLDHEGGKGLVRKDNKVAVFNWDGDTIVSKSTRSLGNAVSDACDAITKDWSANASKSKNRMQESGLAGTVTAGQQPGAVGFAVAAPQPEMAAINVTSNPIGADIEIDGSFVGSTPSSVRLPLGTHAIVIKKSGYKTWERTIRATTGSINVAPELEKVQ